MLSAAVSNRGFISCCACACVAVLLSGNIIGRINQVSLRRGGLVLRWVTILKYTMCLTKPHRPTQPSHPSICSQNEYQEW